MKIITFYFKGENNQKQIEKIKKLIQEDEYIQTQPDFDANGKYIIHVLIPNFWERSKMKKMQQEIGIKREKVYTNNSKFRNQYYVGPVESKTKYGQYDSKGSTHIENNYYENAR